MGIIKYFSLSIFLLGGCTSNFNNVSAFSKNTKMVTETTKSIIINNIESCEKIFYRFSSLKTIYNLNFDQKSCEERKINSEKIYTLNSTLNNFSEALTSLVNGDFVLVSFDPIKNSLDKSNLTAKEKNAVLNIGALITQISLRTKRQNGLNKAFSDKNQDNIFILIKGLRESAKFYRAGFSLDRQKIKILSETFVQRSQEKEPLAVNLMLQHLKEDEINIELQIEIIDKYLICLDEMEKSFKAAARSINNPKNEDIVKEIEYFSEKVYELNKIIRS